MKIGIEYKDMPRGFKAWYASIQSRVKRITFPDADAFGYEVETLSNEVYKEMLEKFPNIKHTIIQDNGNVLEMG